MTADPGVIGYVDGRPVPATRLAERLDALRAGPCAALLPVAGTAEHRQLLRWLAQVILTEELCAAEAAARGLEVGGAGRAAADRGPDTAATATAAAEYGSITAAALLCSPAARAVFDAVTAGVGVDEREVRRYWSATSAPVPERWRLRHRLDGGPAQPLGPVRLGELPAALAGALRRAVPGDTVTVTDRLGRHEVLVVAVEPGRPASLAETAPAIRATLTGAARRREFTRWLGRARAERIALVPGLEHPGDPGQPDNHHRH